MEALTLKSLLTLLVICFVLFLLLREVNLWYWKINRQIELQEETNRLLEKILGYSHETEVKKNNTIESDYEPTSVNDPKVLDELIKKFKKV